jgi:HSP20 family protein
MTRPTISDHRKERSAVSITRGDPWGDLVSLREAMNNLLEESFVRPRQGVVGPGMVSSLALDVKETPDQFTVTASVPGVAPSDLDITVLGDTLRIRGQRKEETEETGEGGRWLLRERRFGAFERTVSVPTTIDAERATADFKDGVLSITLPKAESAKPKIVTVSAGASGPARRSALRAEAEAQRAAETASPLAEPDATQTPPDAVRGDGSQDCPPDYPVKANADSGLYHEPGSSSYAQTIPEFCFASASAAEAAGFRAPGQ